MADAPRGNLARLTETGAAAPRPQLLFFALELAELDDDVAEKLLADEARERWAHWLRSERKCRPYLLDRAGGRSSPRSRCRA